MKIVNSHENKQILLVDDCEDYRQLIGFFLENEKYRVNSVDSAIGGLTAIERQYPDLVILDLKIPDSSGLRIIQHLKNKCRALDIPIILVTANTSLRRENVRDIDALCYKPFRIESFLEQVEYLLTFQTL